MRCSTTACACPTRRSWSPCRRSATLAWHRPGRRCVYVLEPVPNLDGRVDWSVEREPALARAAAPPSPGSATRPTSTSEAVDPLDWEASGHGARHARSRSATRSARPDRSGPRNVERRAPGLVFAGSGTAPGVGVPMVLVSGRLAADRVERLARVNDAVTLRRVLPALPADSTGATARRTTGRPCVLPRVKRHHVYALYAFCRLADDIVDDLGESATASDRAAALHSFADRFFADLDADDPTTTVLKAVGPHRARAAASIRAASSASCGRWPWTSRSTATTRGTTCCDYMDGSAAVIGEMMLPILEPLDPAAFEPRPRPRRSPSSSPTSCATSTRTSTAGGSTCPRRTSTASAPTRATRAVDARLGGADALRDRPLPPALPRGRSRASRCSPTGRRAASRRPHPVRRDPRPHREPPTTTCSPRGPACPTSRKVRLAARGLIGRTSRPPVPAPEAGLLPTGSRKPNGSAP